MARHYVTLSQDLIEFADAAADYLEGEGCRVSVEPSGLYYPNTPTILGKRSGIEYVVEVAASLSSVNIGDWVRYARARNKETYVLIVLPQGVAVTTDELSGLRESGVGLCRATANGMGVIVEARDVSSDIGLPDLSRETAKVRKKLKSAFKKISDGAVVDGFKDACLELEESARVHFRSGVATGRIRLVTSAGRSRTLSSTQIDRLTLGQLGVAYSEVVAPTQVDDLVRRAIDSVLTDRNDAIHRGSRPAVIRRIRRNTPRHSFAILNAMRELLK